MASKRSNCWKAAKESSLGYIDQEKLKSIEEIALNKFKKSTSGNIKKDVSDYIDTTIKNELISLIKDRKKKIASSPIEQNIRNAFRSAKESGKWFSDVARKWFENIHNSYVASSLRHEGDFIKSIKKQGLWEYWKYAQSEGWSGDHSKNIIKELYHLTSGLESGITKDTNAIEIARIIKNKQDELNATKRRLGLDVDDLSGRVTTQSYDPQLLRQGGRKSKLGKEEALNDFVKDFKSKVSSKTFEGLEGIIDLSDDSQVNDYAKTIYGHIESGFHNYDTDTISLVSVQRGIQGKKAGDNKRVIHFKDADSLIYMMDKYGMYNFTDSIYNEIDSSARQIELSRALGPEPSRMYLDVIKPLTQEQRQEKIPSKWTSFKDAVLDVDNVYKEIDGSIHQRQAVSISNFVGAIRAWQAMTHLGFATIKSFGDVASSADQLAIHGEPLLKSYSRMLSDTFMYMISREQSEWSLDRKQIAEGLFIEHATPIGSALRSFNMAEAPVGYISKAVNTYFIANGLNRWTRAVQSGFQYRLSNMMAHHAEKSFDNLPESFRYRIARSGLDSSDWEILRSNIITDEDGRRFITSESIDNSNLSQEAKDNLHSKFGSFFIDQTQRAVPQPAAIENALMRQGTASGTVSGEIMRTLAQFKGFPIAMLTRGIGDRWESSDVKMNVLQTARLVFGLTMSGAAIEMFMQASSGADPIKNLQENPLSFLHKSVVTGGGMSILGDVFLSDFTSYGRSFTDLLAGPTISDIGRILAGTQKAVVGKSSLKNILQDVENIAVPNILGFKNAIDFLFMNEFYDYLDPDYLDNLEKRQREAGRGNRFLPLSAWQ